MNKIRSPQNDLLTYCYKYIEKTPNTNIECFPFNESKRIFYARLFMIPPQNNCLLPNNKHLRAATVKDTTTGGI